VGLRGSVRTERDARAEGREGFHQNIAQLLSKRVHSGAFAQV
jgi:protein required for attachment to host cells